MQKVFGHRSKPESALLLKFIYFVLIPMNIGVSVVVSVRM